MKIRLILWVSFVLSIGFLFESNLAAQSPLESLYQQDFELASGELNGVRRLYDQTESALQTYVQGASQGLESEESRKLFEAFADLKESLPARVAGWAKQFDRGDALGDIDLQEVIYHLCLNHLIDDLVVAGGKGRLFLRGLLNQYAEQGLDLKRLQEIAGHSSQEGPREILVPWDTKHIEKANLRLRGFARSDLGIDLSQIVRFKQAPATDENPYVKPYEGSDAIAHEQISHARNLIIPPLTFAVAFLGGMVDFLGLSTEDPEATRQALMSLTQLAIPAGLGVGLGIAAHKVAKFDPSKIGNPVLRTGGDFFHELRGPIVTAIITLFGVAHFYGPQAIATIAPALVVGGVAAFLEWQFSKFSDWWSTWVWEIGWIEKLTHKVTGIDAGQTENFAYRRMIRPALGTANNFAVNTMYPAVLEGTKFLALLLLVDGVTPSIDLGADTLRTALNFTMAFGVFQIILGNLRSQGDLAETNRFRAETFAVLYNGAIARVLAIGMAASTLGDNMMWGFAAAVTAPAFLYFVSLPLVEKFSGFYQRQLISERSGSSFLVAPYRLFRAVKALPIEAIGLLAKACRLGKARKPVPAQ